jgi:tetratricopeptide (TPR) repeat protein
MEHFAEEDRELEVGEMLNNIGIIRRKQGRWDEAVESLEESLRIFVRREDKAREAQARGNLASVYASLKRREDAEEAWSAAAAAFQDLGDRQKQGDTLMALGVSMFKSGRRQEGLATYQAGMALIEKPTLLQRIYRFLLMLQTRILG